MNLQGHPYSLYAESSLQNRGGVYALLGLTAAIIGLGIQKILSNIIALSLPSMNTYVLILGAWGSIFAILVLFFDRWGWKMPIISDIIFILSPNCRKPPNIGGHYKLYITWKNITKDKKGVSTPRAIISQRWSTLSLRFEFPFTNKKNHSVFRASSSSDMANIYVSHDNNTVVLKYTFEYIGRGESIESRQKTFNGTALLHFSMNEGYGTQNTISKRWFTAQNCNLTNGTFYTDYDEFGIIETIEC